MSFLSEQDVQNLVINKMIFHVVGKNLEAPTLLKEIKPVQHVDFFLERIKSSLKGNLFTFLENSNTERILRIIRDKADAEAKEGANKRGNSSRLTQSFHFFMFEPIFSPVNALNQPI